MRRLDAGRGHERTQWAEKFAGRPARSAGHSLQHVIYGAVREAAAGAVREVDGGAVELFE